jgi:hypothetical protein
LGVGIGGDKMSDLKKEMLSVEDAEKIYKNAVDFVYTLESLIKGLR